MEFSRIILISKFINSGYNKISLFDAQRLCEIVLINPKEPDMSLRKKLGYRSFSLRAVLKSICYSLRCQTSGDSTATSTGQTTAEFRKADVTIFKSSAGRWTKDGKFIIICSLFSSNSQAWPGLVHLGSF